MLVVLIGTENTKSVIVSRVSTVDLLPSKVEKDFKDHTKSRTTGIAVAARNAFSHP